jgi:hypothetical protein
MTRIANTVVPMTTDTPTKGANLMLLHEALARIRMREAEQAAREHRMARQLTAGRTLLRLAQWLARRAERARFTL